MHPHRTDTGAGRRLAGQPDATNLRMAAVPDAVGPTPQSRPNGEAVPYAYRKSPWDARFTIGTSRQYPVLKFQGMDDSIQR